MKSTLIVALLFPLLVLGQNPTPRSSDYKEDFDFFWNRIHEEYAYFADKQTDWDKVKEIYAPMIDTIHTRSGFVSVIEKAFYELYDAHASLNTNNPDSQRLVPSGTDFWAEYTNGKPIITEVRPSYGCAQSGMLPGMEIIAVNDIPVATALLPFFAKSLRKDDVVARDYALRVLLAGNHIRARKFTLSYNGKIQDYFPDAKGMKLEEHHQVARIESHIDKGIGYLKINDCLYDDALIPEIDSVMHTLKNTRGLILDLRNTPSGGNTMVARALLGWFINKDHFYQKHEYVAEEQPYGIKRSWEEIVSPRTIGYYDKPLAILVDHWTGSVSEGITIGFDALKRQNTQIIGTRMARLCGAGGSFEMPHSKIHFTFPIERLYHIDGKPREQYVPPVYVDFLKEKTSPETDLFMQKALVFLNIKK